MEYENDGNGWYICETCGNKVRKRELCYCNEEDSIY
jgi:hypothetical protein